jgi:2-methylisocitrate lyase-like PEP mutase family enzyme
MRRREDTMMTPASRLRALIENPALLVMPGVFDPVSAKLAEREGFAALQCTGAGISAVHLGRPDYSMLSLEDMVATTSRIVRSVDVPVMADADTGFGNAVNVHYTVKALEAAGAAGLNLEDQVSPKRCGHLDGKQLIDIDEAATKVNAAARARRDPDFVINARTDALASEGMDGVVRRGNAYLEAGATMIFVEGVSSREQIEAAVAGIQGPVAVNIVDGGKTPEGLTFADLEKLGVARVSLPGLLLMSAMGGMREALRRVVADGHTGGTRDLFIGFREAHDLIGMREVEELEELYLRPLVERTAE